MYDTLAYLPVFVLLLEVLLLVSLFLVILDLPKKLVFELFC